MKRVPLSAPAASSRPALPAPYFAYAKEIGAGSVPEEAGGSGRRVSRFRDDATPGWLV
jgi:hypothetical protein